MMEINLLQKNSPDGGFLQSEEWRKFQESVGRKTFHIESEDFLCNIIEHKLPIVGKYGYCPRGPVFGSDIDSGKGLGFFASLRMTAGDNNWGWIRIDPANEDILVKIREQFVKSVVYKAPHDMQPKQLLMVNLIGMEEDVLNRMKPKTRYNIKLAQKRGVKIVTSDKGQVTSADIVERFLDLVEVTAKRDKITSHPRHYYRKMLETIPEENLKLYVAEYEGEIIAGVLVAFFGKYATYLHGASDNIHRNVMAPYLIQWHAMQEAKKMGCEWYDLGGINTEISNSQFLISNQKPISNNQFQNKWGGITKFKEGFAPNGKVVEFPGSYDVVINPVKYWMYRIIQLIKRIVK